MRWHLRDEYALWGGGMKFAPHARYDSGEFHVLIVEKLSRWNLAMTSPKVYLESPDHPAVSIVSGREVSIEGQEPAHHARWGCSFRQAHPGHDQTPSKKVVIPSPA